MLSMPDDALVEALRARLPDQFSQNCLMGALHVLTQPENPMRAHQFAATLRQLMDHVLALMGPDADVMRCSWFEQLKDREGPTRRQRALYACRGGLTDEFLKNTLKLDPKNLHRGFSATFEELNNRVHVQADTVLDDPADVEDFVNNALAALNDVFETIDELHAQVADALGQALHGEAMSAFLGETIQELDLLAGHHYETGSVWIGDAKVISLDADALHCQVKGSVDVTLVYGSKGDPAEIAEQFPFECTTVAPATNPTEFDSEQTEMKVDTSSWYGDDEEPAEPAQQA